MNLVWHRADLRTHDNPALTQALKAGPTVGLVVFDPQILDATTPRRKAWFAQNVAQLRQAYEKRGGVLLVRQGLPWEVLPPLAQSLGVRQVWVTRNTTPYALHRDAQVEQALGQRLRSLPGQYVHEPGAITKPDGLPYTVFTPYSKRWWAADEASLPPSPQAFAALNLPVEVGEIPHITPDIPLPAPGEEAALAALETFLQQRLPEYHQTRDKLDGSGVSRLSYYFTLGVLSPRLAAQKAMRVGGEGARKWVAELAWRDFSGDLLYHHPHMRNKAFDPKWDALPWNQDQEMFAAWKQGQTGIPVVDGCMRELNATGFMSNRGRMVVAQALVKLMLLPWQWGERYLKHALLDGDTASNLQGWQWAGGLGVDAAPYFRVFNMTAQGLQHDPDGSWLKRWVPESGGNPEPRNPVLDLEAARRRYLAAAERIAKQSKSEMRPQVRR